MTENDTLQALCRTYLRRLRYIASKHGLGAFVDDLIAQNKQDECRGTRHEVEMLSRMCDDERVSRHDIPALLGVSYRKCEESGVFTRLKKLRHVGVYSKISVLLAKKMKK